MKNIVIYNDNEFVLYIFDIGFTCRDENECQWTYYYNYNYRYMIYANIALIQFAIKIYPNV